MAFALTATGLLYVELMFVVPPSVDFRIVCLVKKWFQDNGCSCFKYR